MRHPRNVHDLENESDDVALHKMEQACDILRKAEDALLRKNAFTQHGQRLDVYGVSHAFTYALVLESLVREYSSTHDHEKQERAKADLDQWRRALVAGVHRIRHLPATNTGARQVRDFTTLTRGAQLAKELGWRMLNVLLHRHRSAAWPHPEDAMMEAVHDYVHSLIHYGRVYAGVDDYVGQDWYAPTEKVYTVLYRIDPSLLARPDECPDSTVLEKVSPGFAKYLSMVYALEANQNERVALVRSMWPDSATIVPTGTTLPDALHVE